MPYVVAYDDAGIKRHEYDTYIRLLGRRGIEWTKAQRVPEPGTENRWIYVWTNRDEAQSFCDEIRKETRDDKWYLRPLAAGTEISSGPLMPVVVHMTRQTLGYTFTLHPHSRSAILRRFPNSRLASSVAIEYCTKFDFAQAHGPVWDHIAVVLSGLSLEQLSTIGGYQVLDLATEKIIHDWAPVLVG